MTDNMMLITLFDTLYPCWDAEMLEAEGADMDAVARLVDEGLLERRGGVYSLSSSGQRSSAASRLRTSSTRSLERRRRTARARLAPENF